MTANTPDPLARSWNVRVLGIVGALAPFNIGIPEGGWTPLLLRPLLTVALAASLVLWLIGRSSKAVSRLEALVLVWLAAVWLSAALSNNTTIGSVGAVRMTLVGVLLLAVVSTVRSPIDAVFVLKGVAVGTVVAVAYGFGVLLSGGYGFGSEHFFGGTTRLGPHLRFTQPWPHANVAAMALATGLAPLVLVARRRHVRLVLPVGAMVLTALVLTYSRGALLAAAVAAGIMIWLHRPRSWRFIASAVALIVVVVALSPGWSARLRQPGLSGFYGVDITAPLAVELDGAEPTSATVLVTNRSTVTWDATGEDQVVLSARWIEQSEALIWAEDKWALPRDLPPGSSARFDVSMQAIVPSGTYDVYWDLLRDRDAYFEQFSGRSTVSLGSVTASLVTREEVDPVRLVPRALGLNRIEIWRFAFEEFKDAPLLGVGPSQIGLRFADERGEERFVPGHHAHNVVLEALSTWGLLGALPFFAIVAIGGLRLFRRTLTSRSALDITVTAALAALMVEGLVYWPLIHTGTAILSGIFLGLAWIDKDWQRSSCGV